MKKIIISMLLVLSLLVMSFTYCYAEPGNQEDATPPSPVAETQNTDDNTATAENQKEADKNPDEKPENKAVPNEEKQAASESQEDNTLAAILVISVVLLLVILLVLMVLLKLGDSKKIKEMKNAIQKNEKNNSEALSAIQDNIEALKFNIDALRLSIGSLNDNISGMKYNPQPAPQPVAPPTPVRELSLEEKISEALNSGSMSQLGMTAVDITDNGGLIEIKSPSGSILFYCNRQSDNATLHIYPDNKIKERAWESRYAQWFNITRNSDTGSIVTVGNPLVIKSNSVSGRYDLINKGNITIF